MAPASSWDNPQTQPRKKGLSVFGKVLIGCGSAMLCFLLAIGAVGWLVVTKASKAMDRGWADIRAELESLRTERGARALYRDNPGLAQNYPTEEEFVKASAEWRSKLGEIPDKRPDFKDIVSGKGFGGVTIKSRQADGRKSVTVRMRLSTGARLVVDFENDKLTDIQVD